VTRDVDYKLELVLIPVADVDRAKARRLGLALVALQEEDYASWRATTAS